MAVNPNTSTILGAFNAMVPKEGPKVVPVTAQLAANASVVIDLTQIQQQGRISFIQGLMIDNSQNTQSLTITSQAFNQKIVVPAGAQAILPVFVINPPVFIAASNGGVNVPLFFFNVPLPAQVWNQGNTFSVNGSGYLNVTDVALDALISNLGNGNGLAVNVLSMPSTLYNHINSNATTAVKAGAGVLSGIVVNNPGSTWTATIYDNTAGSGTVIGVLAPTLAQGIEYGTNGVNFTTGLTIVTAGTTPGDLTIIYH